jgi:serine/threonine protein kinase
MEKRDDSVGPVEVDVVADPHFGNDQLQCGRQIAQWRIERLLGHGGMGDVYAVVHDEIGKRAALKLMHSRLSVGLNAERARIEGQVVNRVDHPNIVDIFDSGEFEGRPYLVMERLEGMTLTQLAAVSRPSPELAIAILLQLCDALAAAHAVGVIHRDLKPDNVFVLAHTAHQPTIKLVDWGIAKVVDSDARRTMEGQLIGTPDYLAPEQACGRPVTSRSDVYALGIIAYELFLGELPFIATTTIEVLTAHFRDPPRPPRELWPEIPTRLERLLVAMLAKEPERRPSMLAIAAELERIDEEMSTACIPIAIEERDVVAEQSIRRTPDRTTPPNDARWRALRTWTASAAILAGAVVSAGFLLRADDRSHGVSVAGHKPTEPCVSATEPGARDQLAELPGLYVQLLLRLVLQPSLGVQHEQARSELKPDGRE